MPVERLLFRCAMCGDPMEYVDKPNWCLDEDDHPHIRCAHCSFPGWAACVRTSIRVPPTSKH